MSVTTCKGRGIYLVQEENDFEVHVRLNPDVVDQAERLKCIVNEQLAWSGTGIHACMIRYGYEIHFQSSDFVPWNQSDADEVFVNVWNSLTIFETEINLKKRKRQVRDVFNKCKDAEKIEQIAKILGV